MLRHVEVQFRQGELEGIRPLLLFTADAECLPGAALVLNTLFIERQLLLLPCSVAFWAETLLFITPLRSVAFAIPPEAADSLAATRAHDCFGLIKPANFIHQIVDSAFQIATTIQNCMVTFGTEEYISRNAGYIEVAAGIATEHFERNAGEQVRQKRVILVHV